jgi:hypothetical protein
MALGGRLRVLIPPDAFRSWLFPGLLILGLEIVWRGLA